MSIVIVGVDADQVLVATDTYCGTIAGPVAKAWPLPHVSCVIAGRGVARLLAEVTMAASASGHDFEGLAAAMPEMLRRIASANAEHVHWLPEEMRFSEVFLTGWSPARQRPAAFHYKITFETCQVESAGYLPDELGGHVIVAPWTIEMGSVPTPSDISTADGLIDIARRQAKGLSDWFGDKAAGGDLIVTRVFRDRMISTSLGAIEGPVGQSGAEKTAPRALMSRDNIAPHVLPPDSVPMEVAAAGWRDCYFIAGLTSLTSRSPDALAQGFRAAAPFFSADQRAQTARDIADVRSEAAAEKNSLTAQHNKEMMQFRYEQLDKLVQAKQATLDQVKERDELAAKLRLLQIGNATAEHDRKVQADKDRDERERQRINQLNWHTVTGDDGYLYKVDPSNPTNLVNTGVKAEPKLTGEMAIVHDLVQSGAAPDVQSAIRLHAELKRDPHTAQNSQAFARLVEQEAARLGNNVVTMNMPEAQRLAQARKNVIANLQAAGGASTAPAAPPAQPATTPAQGVAPKMPAPMASQVPAAANAPASSAPSPGAANSPAGPQTPAWAKSTPPHVDAQGKPIFTDGKAWFYADHMPVSAPVAQPSASEAGAAASTPPIPQALGGVELRGWSPGERRFYGANGLPYTENGIPDREKIFSDARAAIAAHPEMRDQVIERLRAWGVDSSGL